MVSTRVGYAGGTTINPHYYKIGDHAECLEVDFDPERISFARLLHLFWQWHNPFRAAWSRQYMSAILSHDAGQREVALESAAALEAARGQKVCTEILPYEGMTLAEDYHQKYFLRRNHLVTREFEQQFPLLRDFVDSSAVTRANAVFGGHLKLEPTEVDHFGLSPRAAQALLRARW